MERESSLEERQRKDKELAEANKDRQARLEGTSAPEETPEEGLGDVPEWVGTPPETEEESEEETTPEYPRETY
jgi:hypothetical protein